MLARGNENLLLIAGFRWFQDLSGGFRSFQVVPCFSSYHKTLKFRLQNFEPKFFRIWKIQIVWIFVLAGTKI